MRTAPALDGSASAEAVLAHHSKTFNWAARLIPRDRRRDFAVLYAFCRYVDDLVDEAESEAEAREALAGLRADLDAGVSEQPLVAAFLELAGARSIDPRLPRELVLGCESDLGTVRVADDAELLLYCYRVASTVGLMICDVAGVPEPEARPFAVDLGIGMQITNICRDVAEDYERGRIYIPATRVAPETIEAAVRRDDTCVQAAVFAGLQDLLDLAGDYYASAEQGMRYLPLWCRAAVLTAGRTYAAIGQVIRRRGPDAIHRRAWTTKGMKAHSTAGAALDLAVRPMFRRSGPAPRHDAELHRLLPDLPGVGGR
ncbi:MAG: phytoene/squalene synthase family protein [Sumerlaeia bacterium]